MTEAGGDGLEAMPGGVLMVSGVDKHFSGLRALSDVSLTARPGEVTALIGPNGSGKTTLLNVICGFYKADAGTVTLDGGQPTLRPHLMARAGVSRTFQTPLVPTGLTVSEAVASGRYVADYSGMLPAVLRLPGYRKVGRADRAEVARVLDLVGIADRAGDPAASLPLGTRRLLEVARALISRPQVLLLDEAASGLDESEVDQLATLIRRIRDAGGTVVLVEHNFQMVLSLADRITVLAQGRVLAEGTPEQIEHDPRVLREYLGVKGDGESGGAPDDLATLKTVVES